MSPRIFYCSIIIFSCLVTFFFFSIVSEEYLYPVAVVEREDGPYIYLLHQQSIHQLELWLWNPETHQAHKALLSNYIPAGLKMLPGNKGFSFIDNGRVRIQYFHKRSPKSIDFAYPIYDFHSIEWIDETSFYFSAKERERFCIFYYNLVDQEAKKVVSQENTDCMYPQKIGNDLFYIKNQQGTHSIARRLFFQEDDGTEEIIFSNQSPLAFLVMQSAYDGFFLEHPSTISRHDIVLPSTCYHMTYTEQQWVITPIFSFNIPMYFFTGKHRSEGQAMYESILPFLPRYYGSTIFFTHCTTLDTLATEVFLYDLHTNQARKIITHTFSLTFTPPLQSFFAPLVVHDKVFCGGSISGTKPSKKNPDIFYRWIDGNGILHTKLPSAQLP